MNSRTLPSFWECYRALGSETRDRARKVYLIWLENPFHPSLRFKCINKQEDVWSVRITSGYRAVGVLDQNTVTWFWVGDHDTYERFFR